MSQPGRCLAMWSGPRNISTAMLRAWENRSDTVVVDEPFYAHFLHNTGIDHPMRDEVIACGETDWRVVIDSLVKKPKHGLFYQKHITTHWLEHYSVDWLDALEHVFLIREPAPVVASYSVKRSELTAADLGYTQQAALFDLISSRSGAQPTVIDSRRFLENPEAQLKQLCSHLQLAFEPAMLSWPTGARSSDGIWGQHWYDSVNRSSGFAPPRRSVSELNDRQQRIADSCQPYYDALRKFAI